jgi:tetratricopeptide (TPR) repeat protein
VLALVETPTLSPTRVRGLNAAGSVYYWLRDGAAANRCYRTALAEAEALYEPRLVAEALVNVLYVVQVFPEFLDAGEANVVEARLVKLSGELDDPTLAAHADFARAGRALAQGRLEEAVQRTTKMREVVEATGDVFIIASVMNIIAAIDHVRGDFRTAIASAARSAELFAEIGDHIALQLNIRGLASSTAMLGLPDAAARLAGYAARMLADTGLLQWSPPFEPPDAMEIARKAIGPEQANAAFEAGERMSQDEALRLIRSLV